MSEQSCPGCRATKYTNPLMKMLVNVCGHSLCETCVDVIFVRGSGACPQCGTPLRRVNFRLQMFEDASVEKEMRIRKKIIADFNQQESDFDTLREYNDYLEMVEKIIFDLVNNVNVEETKRMIELYRKEKSEDIKRNRVKKSQDMEYLEDLIRDEQLLRERVRREELEEKELLRSQKVEKEKMIDELIVSDGSAAAIVQQHVDATKVTLQSRDRVETQVPQKLPPAQNFVPSAEEPFHYSPFSLPLLGPEVDEEEVLPVMVERRETQLGPQGLAGYHADWNTRLEAVRMLQLAHCGLFFRLSSADSAF